ncbi:hypothetical protein [Natranaeroarchaeum aerophilus]|uniref:Uncharacterized protein n=1 Tax=Natranaeroarchaeum aerophilus TaxID=2917711 RepID=A0AAE3FUP1_9EURY|nr:hypothetical protein [Natranaeroarchaeum aerophilus]MCL9815285.1 hypothetical protein [Natranaeroarchaeum aerophilus]
MTIRGKANGWKSLRDEFIDEATDAEQEEIVGEIAEYDETDEPLQDELEEYQEEVNLYNRRFILRATLTSSFQFGNVFASETEWELADSLSFDQHEDGPADLFVAHSESRGTIVVLAVVQQKNAEKTYERLQNLCSYVESEMNSIEKELSVIIDEDKIEGAVAISRIQPENIANEFSEEDNHWPVSVWELVSGNQETISLVEEFDGVDWTGHNPDGELSKLLSDGIEFADTEHLAFDLFYDSHHQRIYQYLPPYLDKVHANDSNKTTFHISREELVEFLQAQQGAIIREKASSRADELINWWDYIGVISKVKDPDGYDDSATVYTLGHRIILTTNQNEKIKKQYQQKAARALIKRSKHEQYLN